MDKLNKISEDDMKFWGVFAPMSRFLIELNANLERINDSLRQIEEALFSMKDAFEERVVDWDGEHQ